MALTFTKKLMMTVGDKKYRVYEVTHDGSITTLDAGSLELNYIDYAIATSKTALSAVADFDFLSDTTGIYATFANALSSGTVAVVQAWG